jgi:hypothetical protein
MAEGPWIVKVFERDDIVIPGRSREAAEGKGIQGETLDLA